jgi:hypothetical protein
MGYEQEIPGRIPRTSVLQMRCSPLDDWPTSRCARQLPVRSLQAASVALQNYTEVASSYGALRITSVGALPKTALLVPGLGFRFALPTG